MKNTILNVGNGLALLGITTVLCEFVLMNFVKVKYRRVLAYELYQGKV